MKSIFIFFIIFNVLGYSKQVKLTATVTYNNTLNQPIKDIYLKIHVPPQTYYQQLKHIKVRGVSKYKIKKHQKNLEEFVAMKFDLKAKSITIKKVTYVLDIKKQKININKILQTFKNSKYIKPSKNIESNSKQIKAIATLFKNQNNSLYEKLKLAYSFPAQYLNFIPLSKKTSALESLKNSYGDCTEYSYLFVALARNLHIPAREVSVFAFEKNKNFHMPNHNASEIYLEGIGWTPVYPNLSRGKYDNQYKLGNISDNIILFMQEKNWTWSSYISKRNKIDYSKVKTKINWSIKELN